MPLYPWTQPNNANASSSGQSSVSTLRQPNRWGPGLLSKNTIFEYLPRPFVMTWPIWNTEDSSKVRIHHPDAFQQNRDTDSMWTNLFAMYTERSPKNVG